MRRAALLLALAAGCAGPKVYLPSTPEANACARECMAIENQCRAGTWMYGPHGRPGALSGCRKQAGACLRTCPGAMTEDEYKASTQRPFVPPAVQPASDT